MTIDIKALMAGQSNMRGTYLTPPYDTGLYDTYNYYPSSWTSPVKDPFSDPVYGASLAPTFCNRFWELTRLSIGVVPVCKGGRGINHEPEDCHSDNESDVYTNTVTIANAAGPVDFVVFWAGENDILAQEGRAETKAGLQTYVANLRNDLSLPDLKIYIVLPYIADRIPAVLAAIRDGITDAVNEDDNLKICADAADNYLSEDDNIHIKKRGMRAIGKVIADFIITDNINYMREVFMNYPQINWAEEEVILYQTDEYGGSDADISDTELFFTTVDLTSNVSATIDIARTETTPSGTDDMLIRIYRSMKSTRPTGLKAQRTIRVAAGTGQHVESIALNALASNPGYYFISAESDGTTDDFDVEALLRYGRFEIATS